MTCPSCQTENPEGARFCAACGAALREVPSLEGERKFATVLFADVVGSTALAETIDPETWTELMNGAFAFMNAAVARYEGTVGRLMGDGVLAFFGAPAAQEDHAERAVWAALQLQQGAAAYAARVKRSHGIEFRVRVGVASGLVVFAMVGDRAKAEYTAMGDAANVAARLQAAADPGSILVSAETYALVRHRFDARSAGGIEAKGKALPVEAHEILGPSGRTAHPADPDALDARMIGRVEELRRLEDALSGALTGTGCAALIVGEAGVGKSRLLAELRARAGAGLAGWRWREGRAVSYGQSLSYHPWRDLLSGLLELPDGAAPAEARAGIGSAADALGLESADAAALEALLMVEREAASPPPHLVEGAELAERVASAVRSVLTAVAARAPLCVVLEDLHWADGASLDLLHRVADVVRDHRLVLVSLTRPFPRERAQRLEAGLRAAVGDDLLTLELSPLDNEDAQRLLTAFVDVETLPADLRDDILRKTDGNPFFLEEVVRDLVDAGHLVRRDGVLKADGSPVNVVIPDTLLGVLSARLDRLPAAAKRVAQTASVIGRTFPQGLLAEVCARAPQPERIEEVDPHLRLLTNEELVRPLLPAPEYRFKHALSQDAAYDSLLQRRRRELHRRTADVLETATEAPGGDISAQLAYHYLRAEAWTEGATHALVAAGHARRLFALEDAFGYASAALEALEHLEEPEPRTFATAVQSWIELALARRYQEQLEHRPQMFDRLERAETLARALGDTTLLADLLAAHGNVYSLSGFTDQGYRLLQEASELEAASGREPLVLLSHFYAAEMLTARNPRRAAAQFDDIIALARRDGNRGFEAHAFAMKALALARLGEYREARSALDTALELAPGSGSTIKEADVYMVSGMVFYELAEPQRGLTYGTRGLEMALSVRGLQCAIAGYFVAGQGQLAAQRLPEAVEAFRDCRRLGEANGGMELYVNLADAGRAQAELIRGSPTAVGEMKAAVANARQMGDDFGFGYLSMVLAGHELREGTAERAHDLLAPALEHYREAGLRPYLAQALELQAGIHEALGRPDEATSARGEAAALQQALAAGLDAARASADGAGAAPRDPQ
jgi:class 3 adenylate cyclase/tetratricopeptide (TPR) repeat protein